ncbi:MAG: serine hydrolase domain-containing protein [Candidatus Kariarchaeaceae archaeon]|jgi:CubicO group peptidase (beta-lactamase class C family)
MAIMGFNRHFLPFSIVTLLLFFCYANPSLSFGSEDSPLFQINQAPWSTIGWTTSTPEDQGMESEILDQVKKYITSNDLPLRSFVIIKNGYLVYEYYPDPAFNSNTKTHLFSIAKPITTTLIGIAVDQGLIAGVNENVLTIFSNWTLTNLSWQNELTVENLLKMRSGFVQAHAFQYSNQTDSIQYLLDRDMVSSPDSVWSYNHGDAHLLSAILSIRSNKSASEFAQDHLFNYLGISDFHWEADLMGINWGSTGIFLNPLDMAKFGYLYIQNGMWDGNQVLSSEWITTATSELTNYQEINRNESFGYSWWINSEEGYYVAKGIFGNRIFVYPDHDLVVVYTSNFLEDLEFGVESIYNINNWFVLPSIKQDTTSTESSTTETIKTRTSDSTSSSDVIAPMNIVLIALVVFSKKGSMKGSDSRRF